MITWKIFPCSSKWRQLIIIRVGTLLYGSRKDQPSSHEACSDAELQAFISQSMYFAYEHFAFLSTLATVSADWEVSHAKYCLSLFRLLVDDRMEVIKHSSSFGRSDIGWTLYFNDLDCGGTYIWSIILGWSRVRWRGPAAYTVGRLFAFWSHNVLFAEWIFCVRN